MVKQDPEELANVCKVMEDLIRMHISIFTVSSYQSSLIPTPSVQGLGMTSLLCLANYTLSIVQQENFEGEENFISTNSQKFSSYFSPICESFPPTDVSRYTISPLSNTQCTIHLVCGKLIFSHAVAILKD